MKREIHKSGIWFGALLAICIGLMFASVTKVSAMEEPTDPEMAKAKQENEKKGNKAISCLRTKEEQAKLYSSLPPGQAAAPGHSLHETGQACDFESGCETSEAKELQSASHSGHHCSVGDKAGH